MTVLQNTNSNGIQIGNSNWKPSINEIINRFESPNIEHFSPSCKGTQIR